MVRTSFLRLVTGFSWTALFLRAQKIFSLYTRKEKRSHREVCAKLLRCSLNSATAQLELSYSSVGIVIRLLAVQRNHNFPAGRRGLSILKIAQSLTRALPTSYSMGAAEYFSRGKSAGAQS